MNIQATRRLRLPNSERGAWLSAVLLVALNTSCDAHAPEIPVEAVDEVHASEVRLTADAVERYGVRVESVQRRTLVPTIRVPAQVAFNSEGMAHVGIPVQGRVAELRVRLGDEVKRGDALLVVESAELGEAQSEFLQRRGAAAGAEPAVELARDAHERAKALYDKNQGIALTEVQKRESEFRGASAVLASARSAEEAARSRLRLLGLSEDALARLASGGKIDPHFTVFAPIAGQVIEREATLGELVGPDREKLLVLADMAKLWVIADVPENRLRDVARGAKARVLLGGGGEHWCEGVISFISPALNPATRTVRVRIEPTDRHAELLPGVFAEVEIELHDAASREPVLAIPESATQTIDGATVVFVPIAAEPNTFAKRGVTIGERLGDFVPVLHGLVEGELVVVDGTFILKAELVKDSGGEGH
ncbi:MAG: efflux RND transporter periplasmic adaptor subunit [Planctomycetes bacterium]|nr:efflux RND transporter periplasmic adaptor subunit [Planctomycetota bacterium]